jgi:hypothetical protein
MKFTLHLTHASLWNAPEVQAMLSTLYWLGYKEPQTVVGVKEMALHTKGRFNPSGSSCLTAEDGILMRDIFDLTRYLEDKGLRPL